MKAHAAVSSDSISLAIIVGAGNEHDSQRFEQVVSGVRINNGREGQEIDQEESWQMQLTMPNP